MTLGELHLIMGMIGIAVLGVSAVLAIVRIVRGPSILDRVVGADVLIAIVIAALVLEAVIHRHTTTVPIMLVLSLVGFAGAVSVARLVGSREAPRLRRRAAGSDTDKSGHQARTDGSGS